MLTFRMSRLALLITTLLNPVGGFSLFQSSHLCMRRNRLLRLFQAQQHIDGPDKGGSALDDLSGLPDEPIMMLKRRSILTTGAAVASAVLSPLDGLLAQAVGPVNLELDSIQYEETECPPELKAGRIGGAYGGSAAKNVEQACVKVKATVTNDGRGAKPLSRVAVFGFVIDPVTGASVIANNPDLRSDAGQFAQIDEIPVGTDVPISFIFVATIGKDQNGKLPELEFKSVRAISYPGGARFEALSPCELDSLSDECDEQSDDDREALRKKKMRY